MILGCVESWSGTIVVNYVCVWFMIHRVVNVVCLLDCYAIYYLHWMTCMMKLLFLYWTDHHKTYIIWDSPSYTQFLVAYIFFRWGPTRTRYWASSWEWTIRLITIVVIFFLLILDRLLTCSHFLRYVQVFWSLKPHLGVLKALHLERVMIMWFL